MRHYVAGFNLHGQLSSRSVKENFHSFEHEWKDSNLQFVCSFWSVSVLQKDDTFYVFGYMSGEKSSSFIRGLPASRTSKVFGDTSGVRGALDNDGHLYEIKPIVLPGEDGLEPIEHRLDFDIKDIAISDNGTVSVYTNHFPPSPSSPPSPYHPSPPGATLPRNPSLLIYPTLSSLFAHAPPLHTFPTTVPLTHLHASATTFTAHLLTTCTILTYGSALQPASLGRHPTATTPAHEPHPIHFLGGIPIRKVASAGFLSAALSRDWDLYIWGGRMGDRQRIRALPGLDAVDVDVDVEVEDGNRDEDEAGDGYVKLVEIDRGVDIVDFDVGDGHVVVLTAKGEVWVTGDNEMGQLGVGRKNGEEEEKRKKKKEEGGMDFEPEWIRVRGPWEDGNYKGNGKGKGVVKEVKCGPWSTWVMVDDDGEEKED